jgi:streptogramin lyase
MTVNTVKIILALFVSTSFLACKGQGKTEAKQSQVNSLTIGKTVSKLDDKIWAIYQDQKGNHWFGSNGNGIFQLDSKSLKQFTKKDGLCSNNILSIQEDRKGNIYFDTPEGVSKFDGQQFTTLKVAENNSTKNEWKSEPEDLWFRIGWDKAGPFRFDGEYLYHLQFPKNKMEDEFHSKYPNVSFDPYGVYSIYKDSKGNVWFGTSSLGIYQYNGSNMSWMYEKHLTETPEGGSFGIRSIIEDKNGYIWICNPKYKYKILPDTTKTNELKAINYQREIGVDYKSLDHLYFLSITLDNNGDLWMASYDNGVWRNNGKELIQYPIKDGVRNILLFTIYTDNQGELWVGTQNDGVYKLAGDNFEKFVPLK